jgi:hypothetical protein
MRLLTACLTAALTLTCLETHGQTKGPSPPRTSVRQPLERFSGSVGLKTARGPLRRNVRILEWIVDGRTKVEALPLPVRGLAIILLRSGEMTTVIRGRRERRIEGANFAVPPGVPIGIETSNDAAGFDLIVIEEPKQP